MSNRGRANQLLRPLPRRSHHGKLRRHRAPRRPQGQRAHPSRQGGGRRQRPLAAQAVPIRGHQDHQPGDQQGAPGDRERRPIPGHLGGGGPHGQRPRPRRPPQPGWRGRRHRQGRRREGHSALRPGVHQVVGRPVRPARGCRALRLSGSTGHEGAR